MIQELFSQYFKSHPLEILSRIHFERLDECKCHFDMNSDQESRWKFLKLLLLFKGSILERLQVCN